jgi:copper transport protein
VRALALLCLVAALLGGGRALAHAQLVAATPAAGAMVAEAPGAVTLTFSEPVRPLAARWFPSGGGDAGEAAPPAVGPRVVVPLPRGIGVGTLLLSWRVTSADGHPVGGSHIFSVGAPTAPAEVPSAGSVRAAAIGRGVLTLALVFGVGGAAFLRVVDRGPAPIRSARRLALGAAAATVPAAVVALGLPGLDLLGLPAASLLGTPPWAAALSSPFAAMATASALAGLLSLAALRNGSAPLAVIAWGVAAISFPLFGHVATAAPLLRHHLIAHVEGRSDGVHQDRPVDRHPPAEGGVEAAHAHPEGVARLPAHVGLLQLEVILGLVAGQVGLVLVLTLDEQLKALPARVEEEVGMIDAAR